MANADVIRFIQEIAPIIVEEGSKRGYHVFSTVIAQAIIESNHAWLRMVLGKISEM